MELLNHKLLDIIVLCADGDDDDDFEDFVETVFEEFNDRA